MTAENTKEEQELRTVLGKVVSDKMHKTIVVRVDRLVPHKLYRKHVRKFTKLYAHDEKNECRVGDMVLITQSRPLSKLKTWRLVEVVNRDNMSGSLK